MSVLSTMKKLGLDMVPVFLAVFLAYQVNEYRDYKKEQQNLQEAIKNIQLELIANKKETDSSASYHLDMLKNLRKIKNKQDSSLLTPYPNFLAFIQDFSPVKRNLALPRLSDISLETAKRKHAISSMDYETINKISSVYINMEEGIKSTQKILLHAISDPDVIALKDFDRTFNLINGSLQEIYSQEKYLSKQLENTLEHLDAQLPIQHVKD